MLSVEPNPAPHTTPTNLKRHDPCIATDFMDWDDITFDTDEFELHFKRLNILENHTVDEIKKRTTKNTRSGREFGFKPTHLAIGSVVSSRFHVGFESTVDRDGRHPHNDDESLPSSFWIRFADSEKVRR